jgi:hypothetical protein
MFGAQMTGLLLRALCFSVLCGSGATAGIVTRQACDVAQNDIPPQCCAVPPAQPSLLVADGGSRPRQRSTAIQQYRN